MSAKRQTEGAGRAAMKLRLTGMIICMLALALVPAASMADVQEVDATIITPAVPISVTLTPAVVNDGPGNQGDPHVDGDLVSYTDANNGIAQIRYFNFAGGVDSGIPGAPGGLDYDSDVSDGNVVFTRIEGSKQSIWSFNAATAGPAIELAPSTTSLRRGVAIGGNTVAWQDLSFSTSTTVYSELVAYDLNTGAAQRLTDDLMWDRDMAVAPSGNVIVWRKGLTSTLPMDIWQAVKGVDGTWMVSQVTSTAGRWPLPDTNGSVVVYDRVRVGDVKISDVSDICWKPVTGGVESQLAIVGEQRWPNISGNLIAFASRNAADASPNWDIYVYDLSTGALYRLTNTPTLNESLNDVSVANGRVRTAWSVYETDQNVYSTTFALPVANAGSGQAVHPGNVVTLDGSESFDADLNYPLSYLWSIASKPAGSAAALSDPTAANPSFTADLQGDYVIKLTVTDSSGFISEAASVTVSTTNAAPVADAGLDQAVLLPGATVQLDGSNSYDLEGDPLTYKWTIAEKPAGSAAVLSSATAVSPSFTADVYGQYVVELVVSDPWAASASDAVTVSFTNVKPIADAGGNQAVVAGSRVDLNGGASSDANNDALTYTWSFVSSPAGSGAVLTDPLSSAPSFTADEPGAYVVSLVVNDGLVDSDPANITIVATSGTSRILSALERAIEIINAEPPESFKNATMANTLTNKINSVIQLIDQGLYRDALDKLQNDILPKMDGCANMGAPDRNDWITDCAAQDEVYPLIIETIDMLRLL